MFIDRIIGRWRREPNLNIRRIFIFNIVGSMMFYIPVLVLYAQDVAHVSFAGFLLSESAFAATIVLLEVPTGYLSDIWQRRNTLIIAQIIWLIAEIWLLFARDLVDLVLIQILMGIAASLESGTVQALLFEYLAEDNREDEFRKVEGMRFAWGFYAVMLASLPAGLLYAVNHRLPIALTVIAYMITLFISLRIREPVRIKRSVERSPLRDMLTTMRYALFGHREIAAIILVAAVGASASKLLMWMEQPYFAATHIPVEWNGLLAAAVFGLIAINSQLAHKLERLIPAVSLIGLILVGEIVIAIIAGSWVIAPLACLIMLGHASYGLANPVVVDIINQRADPDRRATILSAQSLMMQLLFMLLSVPYGWISDHYGVGMALYALAGFILVLGLPAWLILRQRLATPVAQT